MWRTRVGYAGGTGTSPTYRAMGDHTECFQVEFDPQTIAYEDLLALFWQSHDPTRPAFKTQYASLVLAADDEQLSTAEQSARSVERMMGRPVVTRIERLRQFWLAEDYHQKYYLRNDHVLFRDFRSMFGSDEIGFVNSTSAAMVNGFLAGNGSRTLLEGVVDELGLSDAGRAELAARIGDGRHGGGCPVR